MWISACACVSVCVCVRVRVCASVIASHCNTLVLFASLLLSLAPTSILESKAEESKRIPAITTDYRPFTVHPVMSEMCALHQTQRPITAQHSGRSGGRGGTRAPQARTHLHTKPHDRPSDSLARKDSLTDLVAGRFNMCGLKRSQTAFGDGRSPNTR